jgi:bifunctional UDP-N-acetylglucosamine pyrophosphorylase / glucosamine-1-phosphate N-acetyltransferase
MRSSTPKVMHTIGGRSLLGHALAAARGLEAERLVVVLGHGRDQVVPHVREIDPSALIAIQEDQLGTGHAVSVGLEAIPEADGVVVVTYGDVPLQTTETLKDLVAAHVSGSNAVTVLTAKVPDPFGYGRVLRDASGAVVAIVEEKDATDDQRAVAEINSGIFAYDSAVLRESLEKADRDNAAGEIYLTDVVSIASAAGHRIGAVVSQDTWQTEGANTRSQLAALGRELNRRVLRRWMDAGVEVIDPETTWVDVTVTLAADVCLRPGVQLHGATRVASDAVIGPDTTLTDVEVGAGASVVRTHGSGAVLGAGTTVGPFAYLRPGTVLGADGKIGTFVETKNAEIGPGAKVPHLSYVGDADIGEGTNIGAGTIFANYDGVSKHHTTVGAHCRTASNNTFVAPVTISDGSATGAGTVVRRNVPPGALAVSGGPQRHIEGWVQRKRPGTAAARAAQAALDEEADQ